MKPAKAHLLGIDLIRFSAAFMVMALHLGYWAWAPADRPGTAARLFPDYPEFPELTGATWWGWVGVQVFFVISGFVIAYSAENATAFSYFRSRFTRLMPAVWICSTLTFAALLALNQPVVDTTMRLAKSWVIWPGAGWVDGMYWTLVVEIVFYALVFALLCFKAFRRIEILGWGLVLLSAAYAGVRSQGHEIAGAQYLLLQSGVFFGLGIGLWLTLLHRPSPTRSGLVAAGLIVGCIEIFQTAAEKAAAMSVTSGVFPPVLVWLACIAALWASVHWRDQVSKALGRWSGPIRIIGLTTYPLYLLHNIPGAWAVTFLVDQGTPRFVALALGMVCVIALSAAVAALIEPRVQKWVRGAIDLVWNLVANRGRTSQTAEPPI